MSVDVYLDDADATVEWGRRLGRQLQRGDLVVLSGDLGAGKTTLTRGIGEGLGVRGAVSSPTFVLAREHPATGNGPGLLHVDAYRLGTAEEIDDLDLPIDEYVSVVEWGEGRVEHLSDSRLLIRLEPAGSGRRAHVSTSGPRWTPAAVESLR